MPTEGHIYGVAFSITDDPYRFSKRIQFRGTCPMTGTKYTDEHHVANHRYFKGDSEGLIKGWALDFQEKLRSGRMAEIDRDRIEKDLTKSLDMAYITSTSGSFGYNPDGFTTTTNLKVDSSNSISCGVDRAIPEKTKIHESAKYFYKKALKRQ